MFDVELGYIEDHHNVIGVLGASLSVPEEPFPGLTFEGGLDVLESE